jgi:cytidine deaminase
MHPLLKVALDARQKAIAPLSGVRVGAALELTDGTVIPGCNIESVIPVLSSCAERTAIMTALSQGHRDICRIAIIADFKHPVPPCGACRQFILELAPHAEIIIGNIKGGETRFKSVLELLPEPYRIEDRAG